MKTIEMAHAELMVSISLAARESLIQCHVHNTVNVDSFVLSKSQCHVIRQES